MSKYHKKSTKLGKNKVILKSLLSLSALTSLTIIPLTACNGPQPGPEPEEEPQISFDVEGVEYDKENSHLKVDEDSYIIFTCPSPDTEQEVKSVNWVKVEGITVQSWDYDVTQQKLTIYKAAMKSLKITLSVNLGEKILYKTAALSYDTSKPIDSSASVTSTNSSISFVKLTLKSTDTNALVTDVNLKVNNTVVGTTQKAVITKAGVQITVNLDWSLIEHGNTINVTYSNYALFATESSGTGKAHIKMTDEGKLIPEKVIIPSTFGGASIDGVCDNGFESALATELEFADSSLITSIGSSAFASTKIASITIPEGVTEIPDLAFSNCRSLKTVILPSQLTSIGQQAFEKTIITMLELPTTLQTIGKQAFLGCTQLISVKFNQQITDWHQNDSSDYIDVSSQTNNATYLTRCLSTDENNWGFTGISQTGIKQLNITYDSTAFDDYDFTVNSTSSSSIIYNAYGYNTINIYLNKKDGKNPCPVLGRLSVKQGDTVVAYKDVTLYPETKYSIAITPSIWESLATLDDLTISFEKDVNEKWVTVNLDSSVTDKNMTNTGYTSLTSSFTNYAAVLAISNPTTNPSYYADFVLKDADSTTISSTASGYVKSTANQITLQSIDWSTVEDLSFITLACSARTSGTISYSKTIFTDKYGVTITSCPTTVTSASNSKVTIKYLPEFYTHFHGTIGVYKADGTKVGGSDVTVDVRGDRTEQTLDLDIFDSWNKIADGEELTLGIIDNESKSASVVKNYSGLPEKDGLTWEILTPTISQTDVIQIQATYDTSGLTGTYPESICLHFSASVEDGVLLHGVGSTPNVYIEDGQTKTFTINVDNWRMLVYDEVNTIRVDWTRGYDPTAIYDNDYWELQGEGTESYYTFSENQYGLENNDYYSFEIDLDGTCPVNEFYIWGQWLELEEYTHVYIHDYFVMDLVGVTFNGTKLNWKVYDIDLPVTHSKRNKMCLLWGSDVAEGAGQLIITVKVQHQAESTITWYPTLVYDENEPEEPE